MNVVDFPATGPTPFEIVLSRYGDALTVTFLGSLTSAAAQVLDDVLDRLARDLDRPIALDLSAAH